MATNNQMLAELANTGSIASSQVPAIPVINAAWSNGCAPSGGYAPTAATQMTSIQGPVTDCAIELTFDTPGDYIFGFGASGADGVQIVAGLQNQGYIRAGIVFANSFTDPMSDLDFVNMLTKYNSFVFNCVTINASGAGAEAQITEPIFRSGIKMFGPLEGCKEARENAGCSPCANNYTYSFNTIPTMMTPDSGFRYRIVEGAIVQMTLNLAAATVNAPLTACPGVL